jgi:hydroxypyruvate reductase
VVRAAVEGASAPRAVARALASPHVSPFLSTPIHAVVAGKAAGSMATAIAGHPALHPRTILAIGTHRDPTMPGHVEWHEGAHPVPDARSVAAAERAMEVASAVESDECLMLLLSGGASALMALPIRGITLADKQECIRTMMLAGADIHALNTVRKHLSAVKGGRLAAACRGATLTLAVSDVVGDDLSVIGSGPGVSDATTWRDAASAIEQFGGDRHSSAVRDVIARGEGGEIPDTPKVGDAALARSHAYVIASQRHALDAADLAARSLGYDVVTLSDAVTGQAREAAPRWFDRIEEVLRRAARPLCVLSAGETTVRVTGGGRGGRNQEFILALVERVAACRRDVMMASVGTDGIDGPTDAAGALADTTSLNRASALGLDARACLDDNNAYDFFAMLGDLIHLGRTDTNVGDIQLLFSP